MSLLLYILLFTIIGSVASLVGGILLLIYKDLCERLTPFFVAFAAGSLLTVALVDLIPEALEESSSQPQQLFLIVLAGLVTFFLVERYVFWHHHHHGKSDHEPEPTKSLIIIGDTLHNFIDGVAIAAAFMVSIPVGISTSLAVGLHEIPQEIGDFGALLALGVEKSKVILINLLSAFAGIVGALLGFYFLGSLERLIPFFLAFTAGNFIYVAASDLIPEIHTTPQSKNATHQTLFFLLGIAVSYAAIILLG